MFREIKCAVIVAALLTPLWAAPGVTTRNIPLDSLTGLQPRNVTVQPAKYLGRKALRVASLPDSDAAWLAHPSGTGGGIVVIPSVSFHNGVVEADVAGKPQPGAPPDARGFVGLAFRVNSAASQFEYAYIRPTNGRAEDQLRRNHSTQYSSYPDHEWLRLRTESPGKYESYVDLVPGQWTRIKLAVNGTTMRLYVNGASQPTLVVNDLVMGDAQGSIALWIGVGTEAYFSNLRVSE